MERKVESFFIIILLTVLKHRINYSVGSICWSVDMGFLARNAGFDDFAGPSDDELIEMTQVRSYFPETWIYEEKVIG